MVADLRSDRPAIHPLRHPDRRAGLIGPHRAVPGAEKMGAEDVDHV